MDGFQFFCTIFVAVLAVTEWTWADHEYMETVAESRTVPVDYETKLECVMNIEPDKFQWKFYPLPPEDVSNPKAVINLSKSNFVIVPPHNYTTKRKQSDLTLTISFLSKLGNLLNNRNNLLKTESFLKHPILNDLNQEQIEILHSYVIPFRKFDRIYRILVAVTTIIYGIFRFIGLRYSFESQIASVPDWVPFNAHAYWCEIFCGQMFVTAVVSFTNSSIDILSCSLINFGSAQFEILKNKLENATVNCRINGHIQKEALIESLRTCAKHHQVLIAYTRTVQDTFSAGIFMQFSCSVLMICLTGFQMLMVPSFGSVEFVFALTFIMTIISQISMYCWFGNELRENSSEIPQACYMSDWHESNSEARKLLWIMMERGKTSVVMKAGNFFTLSLTSLMAVDRSVAGDYQCLAYYGASVVASVPWRITLVTLGEFPPQMSVDKTIVVGNTVNWRCESPVSNPKAYIDYYKNEKYLIPSNSLAGKSLIIPNVNGSHTGKYKCKAFNNGLELWNTKAMLNLNVVRNGPQDAPSFLIQPRKIYTVNKGDSVLLECAAVGNPVPQAIWEKKNGNIPFQNKRAEKIRGGLVINNVSSTDDGTYVCSHTNKYGTITHQITLVYNEAPSIECLLNSTDIKQGEDLDLDCAVTGTPEPEISWFLNGYTVTNDTDVEAIGNKIYFRPIEKRHAGNLQIFARNIVKTVYSSISIKVIPLSTSIDISVSTTRSHHRHNGNKGNGSRKMPKHTKMVPPTKPNITRLNDEAVVVRWSVPANKGLPIQFFKVQYKELGPASQHDHHNRGKGSKWMTTNADIPPHINSYEINNLKADHLYRFRIAAVYSNNDNKNSPNSDKFHLKKLDFDNRNPLPIPLITQTETINSTAVKIYWKCDPSPNIKIDGFFVNYISASSAADYLKTTVDGEETNSYVLCYLQPDTVYDIKLQSFSSKSASEFSSIMKAKTLALESTPAPPSRETTTQAPSAESGGISKLYVFIAAGVLAIASIVSAVLLLLFCRKWKQKKNTSRSDRDKAAVEEHHIQADSNDYVVNPKTVPRTNGCVVPPNRITITANPLADADNKNQNMIEMSCLSSQNNNTTSNVQPSASGTEPANSSVKEKKVKNREKRIRNKHTNAESNTSRENYV